MPKRYFLMVSDIEFQVLKEEEERLYVNSEKLEKK